MATPVYVGSSFNQYQPFLKRTHESAQHVLTVERPCRQYIGHVPVGYYNWGNPFCFMPVAVPVAAPSYGYQQRDNSTGRVLLGIAAAAIGGVAIFYTGQSIQQIRKVGEELQEIRAFKKLVAEDTALDVQQKKALNTVADCKRAIFTRIRGNAIINLVLTVVVAVAAVFALIGAIVNLPALMITGAVLGVIGGGAVLLKWGINSGDDREYKQAQALEEALQHF